jgi:multidrug transporter EmrE-like cation transporter
MPAFLLLLFAILTEVVATLSLRASEGFSKPVPAALVVVGYGLSFWLMALALKHIPVGLTYAIWSGLGTALVAVGGVVAFGETMNAMKIASLMVIVAGVAGLSAAGGAH